VCSSQASNTESTFLKDYVEGEAFGELALLYNAPRAATIIADSESTLWSLDRSTFNFIVKDSASKKRSQFEEFLKSVKVLSNMDPYERTKLCDALQTKVFPKDEYIIREVRIA
jgi:cAMP-dependent protein kinase regulator